MMLDAPLPEGLSQLRVGSNLERGDEDDEEEREEGSLQPGEDEIPGLEEDAPQEEEEVEEVVVQQQEVLERKWKEFLQDRRAMRVRNLTFGVPIRSREAGEVLTGVAKVFAKVRSMQLPITRVHTDRAREFSGGKFQKWIRDRDLFPHNVFW